MKKNFIYVLAAFFTAACLLTQAPVQAATKKPEPPKAHKETMLKRLEKDVTGAAKNVENKIEQHGVKKHQEKQKQDKNAPKK